MNRRGFIKVITALGASVALPVGSTTLAEATQALASGVAPIGLMREAWAFDIFRDQVLLRFDICTGSEGKISKSGDVKFSVDMAFASKEEMDERMEISREIAKELFNNKLKDVGLTWDDLRPMRPIKNPVPI